jgi:uncharacterized sulfatase
MPFTPLTKEELEYAIKDYIINKKNDQYGLINEWDVSNIQDMEGLFENYNEFDDDIYNEIEQILKKRLAELQHQYHVTEKEFERANKEQIKRNYKGFERLRGQPMEAYEH